MSSDSHPSQAFKPSPSRIVRTTGSTVPIRWVLLDATAAAQAIADAHGAKGFSRSLLGETLAAALLLASRLKGPGTLQLRLKMTGDISLCAADATPLGLVRARIPAEELKRTGNFEPMILPRLLEVRKLDAQGASLSESLVEMTDVDVSTSLSYYLVQSEQVEAHLRVGSRLSEDGMTLVFCGGFLAETFPGADAATRLAMRQKVDELQSLEAYARPEGLDIEALFTDLRGDIAAQIHQSFEVKPYCPCSKAGVLKALTSLSRPELAAIVAEENELELHCEFCRKRYVATHEEMQGLLDAAEGQDEDEAEEEGPNPSGIG